MTVLEEDVFTAGVEVCELGALIPDRGVAALVDGHPVAVFLLSDGTLHAVDNVDPATGVGVLSRGLVGEVDGTPTIASPLHKHRYELPTGRGLDGGAIAVHDIGVLDGRVAVRLSRRGA